MAKSLSGLVHVGLDILTTSVNDTTNRILAQTGDVTRNSTDSDGVEWWQHSGFASRPSKPLAGKQACQGVILKTSGRDVCIASSDQRTLPMYANLDFGEVCVYAGGEEGEAQARHILKKDGSQALYTTDDNTAEGQAVYFRVAKDAFEFVAPWGTIKFDANGFRINHRSGAQFALGGIYGLPPPFDQFGSYVRMQAATITGTASNTSFGSGVPGTYRPLADATATAAQITSLQAQIASLVSALALLRTDVSSASGAGTSSAAPITTLSSNISSTVSATATAVLTIPASTSSS